MSTTHTPARGVMTDEEIEELRIRNHARQYHARLALGTHWVAHPASTFSLKPRVTFSLFNSGASL